MKTNSRIETIMQYLVNHVDEFDFQRFKSTKSFYGFWVDIDTPEVQARVVPIKSYKTIVGYVDCDEEVFYEYGKYTPTTSKQITQLYNTFYRNFKRELVDVDPDFQKLDWGCTI